MTMSNVESYVTMLRFKGVNLCNFTNCFQKKLSFHNTTIIECHLTVIESNVKSGK